MNHVLWSGCRDDQTSADAYIDNDFHGAFTYHFCELIGEHGRTVRSDVLAGELRTRLKNERFSQVPQLEPKGTCLIIFGGSPGDDGRDQDADLDSPDDDSGSPGLSDNLSLVTEMRSLRKSINQLSERLEQRGLVSDGDFDIRPGSVSLHGGQRSLVNIHGICKHEAGYSDDWWDAMKSHLREPLRSQLAGSRAEVLWSRHVTDMSRSGVSASMAREERECQMMLEAILAERATREAQDQLLSRGTERGRDGVEPPQSTRALFGIPGLDCVDDFVKYLRRDSVREAVIAEATNVLRPRLQSGELIELVSHSWGTVVAYEALCRLEDEAEETSLDGKIRNWFTVGAALAIGYVAKQLRPGDGHKPRIVDKWWNLDARADFVGGSVWATGMRADGEFLDLDPVSCEGRFGWVSPACAHSSYFDPENIKTNRDIFALEDSALKGSAIQSNAQPLFRLATAHVRPCDQPVARSLGEALFDRFNRDSNNPMAFGLGMPVAIDVPLNWLDSLPPSDRALRTLLVIVAGSDSVLLESDQVIERLNRLSDPNGKAAQRGLRLLLAPTDRRWIRESKRLQSLTVCETAFIDSELQPKSVLAGSLIDCVVLEISKQLQQLGRELVGSEFVAPGTWTNSIETKEGPNGPQPTLPWMLLPGSVDRNGDRRLESYFDGVFEASDELMRKATEQRPRLSTVLAVREEVSPEGIAIVEQQRSLADQYGWPTVMIGRRHLDTPDAYPEVLRLAAIEHLRQRHFMLQADRICQTAGLPINTAILPREPKLIDLANGILRDRTSSLVVHPDPVLPPRNRQTLRSIQPRLRLATPSTLMGRGARQADDLTLQTPLDDVDVGLSISVMGDEDFAAGNTYLHLENAAVQVVRTLLSGGCKISYGGSFVVGGTTSFNPILANLVETYHETANQSTDLLKIYLAAHEELTSVPSEVRCHVRHLALSDDLQADPIFTRDDREGLPSGMPSLGDANGDDSRGASARGHRWQASSEAKRCR